VSTASTVIDRTLRQVLSGTNEERNKLNTALNATSTSVVCAYDIGGLRAGKTFQIDAEMFYIWEATSGTKTLTVERAWNGTTAAAHTANSIITVDPRFPRAQVLEAVNAELDDLSSPMNGLFQVKTFDVDYNGTDTLLNLPQMQSAIDLMSVSLRYTSDDYPVIRKVKLVRDLPTDDFTSGFALKFEGPVRSGRLRVVYKAAFGNITAETQNLQNYTGIPTTCEDILSVGAQIRLISPREIKRNFTESQGDTRRSDEVPAGAVNGSLANLQRLRRDRITAEAARLQRQYPTFLSRD
jgi:hypothetical protein